MGEGYFQIKAPLRILHRCPAQSFNNEVTIVKKKHSESIIKTLLKITIRLFRITIKAFRFLTQMYGSEVGVTGSRFFVVNQKILLGVSKDTVRVSYTFNRTPCIFK